MGPINPTLGVVSLFGVHFRNHWCGGYVVCVGIIGVMAAVMTEKSCVVDETTDLNAKFARLRCKSIRGKSSSRFNTTNFSLVHSREKLWSIKVCCPGRRGGREDERRFLFSVRVS